MKLEHLTLALPLWLCTLGSMDRDSRQLRLQQNGSTAAVTARLPITSRSSNYHLKKPATTDESAEIERTGQAAGNTA